MSRRVRLAWIAFAAVMFIASALLVLLSSAQQNQAIGALLDVAVPLDPARHTDGQTLMLESFRYQASAYTLGEITVTVRNSTDRNQEGWAWIILAPPDAAEAWRAAVFTSPEERIALAAGASRVITFAAPAGGTVPNGTYRLSAWVHGVDANGARFHSDAAGAPRTQYLGPPYPLSVSGISRAEQIDGSTALDVIVIAENQSGQPLDARITFSVIALTGADSQDSGGLPAFVHPGYATRIESGERTASTLRGSMRLASGRYRVIVWLRDAQDRVLNRIIAETILSL